MKIRDSTSEKIAKIMCGDAVYGPASRGPYLKGPAIVNLLNDSGLEREYTGFGSRWYEMQRGLVECIDKDLATKLFTSYYVFLDQADIEKEQIAQIFAVMNNLLSHENYKLEQRGNKWIFSSIDNDVIDGPQISALSTEFLDTQIEKCRNKITENDFDGAITNARSMVEEVLLEIRNQKTGDRGKYDGDISNLYKDVRKMINLNPDMPGITQPMQQIYTGMTNIILGVGSLRSKISDAHAPEYIAQRHHAVLCVNCAYALVMFLSSIYDEESSTLNQI